MGDCTQAGHTSAGVGINRRRSRGESRLATNGDLTSFRQSRFPNDGGSVPGLRRLRDRLAPALATTRPPKQAPTAARRPLARRNPLASASDRPRGAGLADPRESERPPRPARAGRRFRFVAHAAMMKRLLLRSSSEPKQKSRGGPRGGFSLGTPAFVRPVVTSLARAAGTAQKRRQR